MAFCCLAGAAEPAEAKGAAVVWRPLGGGVPEQRAAEIVVHGATGGESFPRGAAASDLALSGHMAVSAHFDVRAGAGLALIRVDERGRPDLENFVAIYVREGEDDQVVCEVRDCQNGTRDVLDCTGRLKDRGRYRHTLDGAVFSLPGIAATDGRVRIMHDALGGFFHLYYGITAEIAGERRSGWIELAPSKEWLPPETRYVPALLAADAPVRFTNVRFEAIPSTDRDDSGTGFRAVRRPYTWSGFTGDAVVVTFGDELSLPNRDTKFVFWSEANFVPVWHLGDQLLYCYEFVETWGGGQEGCHEPMSDRLKRWSRVEVLEDNAVRKVVR